MNLNMNDKKIKVAYWPDRDNEKDVQVKSEEEKILLKMSATHHGDHDEFWIVELQKNKKGDWYEYARYNPRYVDVILWEKEEEK